MENLGRILLAGVVSTALNVLGQIATAVSPDGKNEIRLMTEPVLSYAVYRGGVERVAPTPLSLDVEGIGKLGGAGTSILRTDAVELKGVASTPIYKKSTVDERRDSFAVQSTDKEMRNER